MTPRKTKFTWMAGRGPGHRPRTLQARRGGARERVAVKKRGEKVRAGADRTGSAGAAGATCGGWEASPAPRGAWATHCSQAGEWGSCFSAGARPAVKCPSAWTSAPCCANSSVKLSSQANQARPTEPPLGKRAMLAALCCSHKTPYAPVTLSGNPPDLVPDVRNPRGAPSSTKECQRFLNFCSMIGANGACPPQAQPGGGSSP